MIPRIQAPSLLAHRVFSRPFWAYFRASQSCLQGHPAAAQARSSSARQSVDLPIRTGRGIQPALSHARQVRSAFPQVRAASRALKSKVSATGTSVSAGLGRAFIVLVLMNQEPFTVHQNL